MGQRTGDFINSYARDINVIKDNTESKQIVYNKRNKSYLYISIITFIISIIALCVSCYRTPDLGFDYMGVLVGILALLVAILLGWNIYAAVQLNEIMDKKIEEAQKRAERKINIALATAQIRILNGYIANQDWCMVMRGYSTCIWDILQLQEKKMAGDIILLIDSVLCKMEIRNKKEEVAFKELIDNIKRLSTLDARACDLYLKALEVVTS